MLNLICCFQTCVGGMVGFSAAFAAELAACWQGWHNPLNGVKRDWFSEEYLDLQSS
jgi:hypothetical protein